MKKNENTIEIVCASDNYFSMPLAVMLKSLCYNLRNSTKVNIYVLDGGITYKNKKKITYSLDLEKSKINWIPINNSSLKGMKISNHISLATYYRLLIPSLIPSHINKVIYLDSDILVNTDIKKLWDIPLNGKHLLAVPEQGKNSRFFCSKYGIPNYKKLGLPGFNKVFNAGMMVINLKKWRSDNIELKTINYIKKNIENILWWDQEALNVVLINKWSELDYKWNLQTLIFSNNSWKDCLIKNKREYKKLIDKPFIIHFNSGKKPWKNNYSFRFKDLFFHYLNMTQFKGYKYNYLKDLFLQLKNNPKNFAIKIKQLKDYFKKKILIF